MKKIRVAILDDEINCVEKMKIVITQNFSNREMVIDEYTSKDKLLDNKACYDIILVDLELDTDGKIDEGMDFITLYREQDKDALMIIVTSHDELARDGYKFHNILYHLTIPLFFFHYVPSSSLIIL